MTHRFVGEIKLLDNENPKFEYPTNTNIPPKQEWNSANIWEDNGKLIKPVNQNAIIFLDNLVKQLEELGFKRVKKNGNRKTTSLKYAIEAYTSEFKFLKD